MIYAKVNLWDEDTKTLTEIDERVFSDCVVFQLQVIREKAKELILAVAPEYKQRNAALGLLTQQEINEIKANIQSIRTVSNQKEAEILSVVWDGTEANRPAACDSVQAVRWD
jgi:hypothetical protein